MCRDGLDSGRIWKRRFKRLLSGFWDDFEPFEELADVCEFVDVVVGLVYSCDVIGVGLEGV